MALPVMIERPWGAFRYKRQALQMFIGRVVRVQPTEHRLIQRRGVARAGEYLLSHRFLVSVRGQQLA